MTRLRAESPVYGGYVMAREGGVVFIRGAVPGELVDVSLVEKKKDYSIAEAVEILEPSEFRVTPPCKYFGRCGGCQLQHISYGRQATMKEEVLLDCLKRIGGMEAALAPAAIGEAFHYRHRAQFKVSKEGAIGFFREGTRDVVPIDYCPLMKEPINEALGRLMSLSLSGIKEVHITSGDCLIALIKGRGFDERISSSFTEAGFDGVAFDDNSHVGKGYVSLPLQVADSEPMTYTVSPWAFFQSNWELNNAASGIMSSELMPLEGKKVVYMYAGAGNFALPLSRAAGEVVAVEENPNSVRDGERNVKINGIKNFKFIGQKAEKAPIKGDIVILDPPRPGLTDKALNSLLDMSPEKIAYVSCNPSTLARDLKKFSAKYELSSIRMMDFFPNTYHIEALTVLGRKG